jgi:hypothetical protein
LVLFVIWEFYDVSVHRVSSGATSLAFELISAVLLVSAFISFSTWLIIAILAHVLQVGMKNPNVGLGLQKSDFRYLVQYVAAIKFRVSLMLIGSTLLSVPWWIAYIDEWSGRVGFGRVISLFGDISILAFSLASIAIIGALGRAFKLRVAGATRENVAGKSVKIVQSLLKQTAMKSAVSLVVLLSIWSVWTYLKTPPTAFGVFVISVSFGAAWELSDKKSSREASKLDARIMKILSDVDEDAQNTQRLREIYRTTN